MTNFYRSFLFFLYSFPSVLHRALYKTIEEFFFQNTSFPYFKLYYDVRKHISDTSRHSTRVQNTILISKTYFQDEKYDFFLLKLQGKMTNFFRSFYIAFPSFYTGPYTKRSKNFFFQNTSFPIVC